MTLSDPLSVRVYSSSLRGQTMEDIVTVRSKSPRGLIIETLSGPNALEVALKIAQERANSSGHPYYVVPDSGNFKRVNPED